MGGMNDVDDLDRMHAFDDEISARILAIAQTMRRDLAKRARYMTRSEFNVSPSDVARALDCSRANATKIVQRLERAGYITSFAPTWQPKSKTLVITPAGRRACAMNMRQLGPGGRFFRLSNEERKELYRLLGLVLPKYRQVRYVD